jgi:hypothetical protein
MENGIPKVMREAFAVLAGSMDDVFEPSQLASVQVGSRPSPRLKSLTYGVVGLQVLVFTGTTDGDRRLAAHVDRRCWPQGGVVSLFLHASSMGIHREVSFCPKGKSKPDIVFKQRLGGVYFMGPRLFGNEQTTRKHCVENIGMSALDETVVLLFRLNPGE